MDLQDFSLLQAGSKKSAVLIIIVCSIAIVLCENAMIMKMHEWHQNRK